MKIKEMQDIRLGDLTYSVIFYPEDPFTLDDVFSLVKRAKTVDLKMLSQILRCPYAKDIIEEADSQPFQPYDTMHNLILFMDCERHTTEEPCELRWNFCGEGKVNDRKEKMGLEFSPAYKLKGYPIKLASSFEIVDFDKAEFFHHPFYSNIAFADMLYEIFNTLCLFGSPGERDWRKGELDRSIQELDSSKCISHVEMMKKIKQIIGGTIDPEKK